MKTSDTLLLLFDGSIDKVFIVVELSMYTYDDESSSLIAMVDSLIK